MKDLIIVGAGGFGQEAYYLAKVINKVSPQWNIKGFINDIPVDLEKVKIDLPILGTIKEWQPSSNEVFAMGISSPGGKEKVANILKSRGASFVTLVHPCALIGEHVAFGDGCVVGGRASIGACANIGNFVHIAGSAIGQSRRIGDYSTTTAFTNVATGNVGKRTFVSSHAVILKDVGDDAFVAAGSIVMSKVKSGTRVMGCPAKRMII